MTRHPAHRYCPECHNVLDVAVGDLWWCDRCQMAVDGTTKGFIARCRSGHEVTEARRKQGKILMAWCDECGDGGEWVRLTYTRPVRSENEIPGWAMQEEFPF